MTVILNEIFYSISGEGISQGIPTVFIRLAGCSLRCGLHDGKKLWCDTGYALSEKAGNPNSIEEIYQKILDFNKKPTQIIITGGEPLEGIEKRNFCVQLAKMISQKRHNFDYAHIRIETNGKESILNLDNMVFSIDYKLPGSGMETFMNRENFQYIKHRNNSLDEVKFVVRDKIDFERACEVIREFDLNQNLIFSNVYSELEHFELAEWIKLENIKGAKLSLQLHKILYGERRGV